MAANYAIDRNDATLRNSQSQSEASTAQINIANEVIAGIVKWRPALSNLYEVAFQDMENISVLHCSEINFPGLQLSFERHLGTKKFALENCQLPEEVTITWREDYKHSVRRFHENWFALFYDRNNDKFISATNDTDALKRYKTAIVTIQDLRGSLYKVGRLYLIDMLPTKIPDLSLGWANDAVMEYQLSYKISDWKWEWYV